MDQQLIAEALALSNFSTENQLIEDALREYIQRRQQQKILELFGTIDYEENF
ncbi:MAG: type II toxin-antitoxin system VapB family antitoxin [Planktothrix sp.]